MAPVTSNAPARSGLFRSRAVAAQQNPNAHVRAPAPLLPPRLAGTACILAIALAASVFALHYAPSATLHGELRTTVADVPVYPARDGTVTAVPVRDGQAVSAGDPLVMIGARAPDLVSVQALRDEVDLAATGLALDAARAAAERRLDRLREDALRRGRVAIVAELALAKAGERAHAEAHAALAGLAGDGHVSVTRVRTARIALLQQARQRARLERELVAADTELAEHLARQPAVALDRARERTAGSLALSARRRALRAAEHATVETVRAPVDGIVTALRTRPGAPAQTGQPLLSLVPGSARYDAWLEASSRSVGYVSTGDHVRLRVAAYPYARFGFLNGRVATVAATPTRAAGSAPAYRVRVELSSAALAAWRGGPLRSGMAVSADVRRERRRLVAWLFQPILDAAAAWR